MAIDHFVWTANLSDGSTKAEAELTVPGELSAYQKLLKIMKDTATTLTGFRFQRDGTTHTAPSASPKAKFRSNVPFTLDYRGRFIHSFGQDGSTKDEKFSRYIVRLENNIKISLWVEDASGDTWMQVETEPKQ